MTRKHGEVAKKSKFCRIIKGLSQNFRHKGHIISVLFKFCIILIYYLGLFISVYIKNCKHNFTYVVLRETGRVVHFDQKAFLRSSGSQMFWIIKTSLINLQHKTEHMRNLEELTTKFKLHLNKIVNII